MGFFNTGQQQTIQSPVAMPELAQLLASIPRRQQAPDMAVPPPNMQAQPMQQGSTSGGASALGRIANQFIGSLVNPTQLPWQSADPSNPGQQLPWQQSNPATSWDNNGSLGGNLANQALKFLQGL